MIFVTTGSAGFVKLVKEIDRIAPKLQKKLLVNIGYSDYKPKNCEWIGYTDKFEDYVKKAELIITHGGAGSIFTCLKIGGKIIAVPNTEHVKRDDQRELIDELSKDGYLIGCSDLGELENCIRMAKTYKFKKYTSPKCEIGEYILEFLEKINQ